MAPRDTDRTLTAQAKRTISIDAMGGEQGLAAVVGGVSKVAREKPQYHFMLHGDAAKLNRLVKKRRMEDRITAIDAGGVVKMTDKPSQVMRHGKGTSMWSALDAVRNREAAVAVSCGNTGALMALSMLRLRKLPGVNRPAIAILWPSLNTQEFNILLDAGADIRADAQDLLAYALMGASYARNGLDLDLPRVGLLNVGTEEGKGRPELAEADSLLRTAAGENRFEYHGFVEGGDIPADKVDIIVTDGFTGNVALKTGEGTANLIGLRLREAFRHTPLSRIGALFAYTSMRRLRHRIDPRRVNGGVFLGLNGTVIKSHGSSDATAVAAAVQLAIRLADNGFAEKLAARVASGQKSAQKERTSQVEEAHKT